MADVLALFLKFRDDSAVYGGSQYRHITAEVCTIADDDTPRNLTGGYSETPGLDDLAVTAQLDNTSSRSYGWTVEYRGIHSANTRRVLAMAATMRKVESAMQRANDRAGYAETFGEYVLRAAEALKITRFIVERVAPANGTYSTGRYSILDASAARYWIGEREREYVTAHAETVR